MRILNYNIEYGGYIRKIKPVKYADIIIENKVDVFICAEPHYPEINRTTKKPNYDKYGENAMEEVMNILEKKGFTYYHMEVGGMPFNMSVISKYPISKTRNKYIYKLDVPDIIYTSKPKEVLLIPVHLDDTPFTFYTIRGIPYDKTPDCFKNKKEIVESSYSTKSKIVENILQYIRKYPNKKYIVGGDFNEPSHLDDPYNEWIISKKFLETGLIDTYRNIQDKKGTKPIRDILKYNYEGATCCNDKGEIESLPSRIDYIYVKNMEIVDSKILKKYKDYSDHMPVLSVVKI